MATTTAALIRDRIISVIEALSPRSLAATPFQAYREERNRDFIEWVQENATAAFRRFSVRDAGSYEPAIVSNTDVELRTVEFRILVAYPHTHRYGNDAARDMDDVIELDQHQIEHAVGMRGYANFAGGGTTDATWVGGSAERAIGDGVTVLSIAQSMQFYRAMP